MTVAEMLEQVIEDTAADADALGAPRKSDAAAPSSGPERLRTPSLRFSRRTRARARATMRGRRHRLDRQRDIAVARTASSEGAGKRARPQARRWPFPSVRSIATAGYIPTKRAENAQKSGS